MKKHILELTGHLICVALMALAMNSCTPAHEFTDVLAFWDMEETDPSVPVWNKELKRELRIHGVHARIENVYLPHDRSETYDLSGKLDMMEADGNAAGLIIAEGDMNLHLLYDSRDPRLKSIPAVSFGAHFPTLADRSRHPNIGIIKDTLDITRNIELMHILWPETRQFVTNIDWTQGPYDEALRNSLELAASRIDTASFIDNVKLRFSDQQMTEIMKDRPEASSLTALSLWDPWVNVSTVKRARIYPQYAFNPAAGGNRVIFYKNDKTTRQMTDDKSFMAFCTAVPQQFEVCDSCAGGFLAPIDVTMKQVAKMSGNMLSGNAGRLPILYLDKDYYMDWNVLRGRYELKDIPSYIQVRNTNIKDRDAGIWAMIIAMFAAVTAILAIIMMYFISKLFLKSRSIKRSMLSSARESIRIKDEFDFIRAESNIHIWSVKDDRIICEDPYLEIPFSDITNEMFDDFYLRKVMDFLRLNTPGKHLIQVYGQSPVPPHKKGWLELRMLIKETASGMEKTGVSVDIDDVKKAEAQLIETRRRLVNAQERDSFISSISHEMRTPLNSILGFSQVITDPTMETDEEERKIMRNAVIDYGDELTNIINNILALTRIENGAVQMTLEDCKVIGMMEDICCDMDVKATSNSIILDQDGGPEESTIKADKLIFKIIVQNVIGNAIKFSEPGGHVSVSWEDHEETVVINVTDHGIGIDKNNQSLIFSRFYKVDQFSQGVGLGLSIAWEYITRMGGSIYLESSPGKGSSFHLAFSKTGKEVRV